METDKIYHVDINKKTIENINYREVLYTVPNSIQLVVMSILPGDTIHKEIHRNTSQFIRVESGEGVVEINYSDGLKRYKLQHDTAVIIPYNITHKIINTGKTNLKLYTIYTPPEHSANILQINNPDK